MCWISTCRNTAEPWRKHTHTKHCRGRQMIYRLSHTPPVCVDIEGRGCWHFLINPPKLIGYIIVHPDGRTHGESPSDRDTYIRCSEGITCWTYGSAVLDQIMVGYPSSIVGRRLNLRSPILRHPVGWGVSTVEGVTIKTAIYWCRSGIRI